MGQSAFGFVVLHLVCKHSCCLHMQWWFFVFVFPCCELLGKCFFEFLRCFRVFLRVRKFMSRFFFKVSVGTWWLGDVALIFWFENENAGCKCKSKNVSPRRHRVIVPNQLALARCWYKLPCFSWSWQDFFSQQLALHVHGKHGIWPALLPKCFPTGATHPPR